MFGSLDFWGHKIIHARSGTLRDAQEAVKEKVASPDGATTR